jgi:hypothetical protein
VTPGHSTTARRDRVWKYRMDGMKPGVPKSVDEYIDAQPEAVRPKLEQVRAAIRKAVPEAVESIGYRMPGYKLHGKPMLYFAGFKEQLFAVCRIGYILRDASRPAQGLRVAKGDGPLPAHEAGTGEADQPDCETACGWDYSHSEKAAAEPKERRAQFQDQAVARAPGRPFRANITMGDYTVVRCRP